MTEGGRRRRDEGRRDTGDRRGKMGVKHMRLETGNRNRRWGVGVGDGRREMGGRIRETREGIRGTKTGVEISAFSYSVK